MSDFQVYLHTVLESNMRDKVTMISTVHIDRCLTDASPCALKGITRQVDQYKSHDAQND